jgi:hypothetical protein
VYHPQLDKWLQETKQHELLVQDPISHELLDISVSSSADDVARCTVAESSEELFLHITHSNDVLDTALGEIGLKQNTDKQEHIVYFSGAGANSYLAHIYKEGMLPGKSCVSAKYLGGWRHFKGSNDMEIRARRRAAEIGFMAMGKFWARQSATSAAKIVFSAMVRNAALSGLENLVLSDAEYQQVDATIFRFARKVLRGAACKKVVGEDGSTQYHAIPDSDVGKLLSFVPAKLELRVRRLQFWQSVARDPFLHRQVLATVFRQLWYDESATVLGHCMWMRMRGQNNWRLTYSRFFPWILQLKDWPALETEFFLYSQIFEMISCAWIVVNSELNFLESAYRLLVSAKLYWEKWKQHLVT